MSIFPSRDQCLSLENICHSFLMLHCRRMTWECKYNELRWVLFKKSFAPLTFISPPPVKPEGTIGLHSVRLSVRPSVWQSVRPSHSFSGLFLAMLSHIWMKVGSKLPYEELQIKFDFRHGWPTFSWVIALCSKIVFRTFLSYAFTYLNESW